MIKKEWVTKKKKKIKKIKKARTACLIHKLLLICLPALL